jgi:hypothetical protein
MKTPIDYLATEFKAITRMDLSAIPSTELIHDVIKTIAILIEFNVDEDIIIRVANQCAADIRDRTFLMYA